MNKLNTLVILLIIMITGNIAIADTCSWWMRYKEPQSCAINLNNFNERSISSYQRTEESDNLKRILLSNEQRIAELGAQEDEQSWRSDNQKRWEKNRWWEGNQGELWIVSTN